MADQSKLAGCLPPADNMLGTMTQSFVNTPRNPKPNFEPSAKWAQPLELDVIDLVVGTGEELREAQSPGMKIHVNYLCFDSATGYELESTWDAGNSFEFYLDNLIDCWSQGLLGMKVGGRRVLVSPSEKAYGGVGAGHPKSGRSLVYLIDLLEVESPFTGGSDI